MNKLLPILSLVIVSFASGWYVSHTRDTVRMQQTIIEVQAEIDAQKEKANALSQELQEHANRADTKQAIAEIDIATDFAKRIEQLHNQPADTSSTDVPDNASTTCKISANFREHDARVRRAFRELREEVLTIARDRDITASHYNELISLYNDLLEQINKGNSTNAK